MTAYWADDPETDADDVRRCEREIDRLQYRPLTLEVRRKLAVERRWLKWMTR